MKSKNHSSTTQPLMASALLAVAFVVTTSRTRVAHGPQPYVATVATENVPTPWRRRIAEVVDRQLIRLFHCALPSGLEFQDLDLSDLER
ncbi:MAG: hypothetical protein KDE19_03480 [Caldilineaceae bacterium]|nr:hypothetical protein [Caldilineaceae bacterium]